MKNEIITTNTDRNQIVSTATGKQGRWQGTLISVASTALCAVMCGCGTVKVSSRQDAAIAALAGKHLRVYVADFELNASNVTHEATAMHIPVAPPTPSSPLVPPVPGMPKDPNSVAHKLAESMTASLVKDLRKAGLDTWRLPAGEPMPESGWLVRGTFTQVNQGNDFRRSVVGFGLGKTELHVMVDLNDLSQGEAHKFCELDTTADSGKAPGCGPTFVGAARLILASSDLDRTVKQAASKIAAEVVERTKPVSLASNTP